MSKNLKKTLYIGLASLMVAGVGATATPVLNSNINVSASRRMSKRSLQKKASQLRANIRYHNKHVASDQRQLDNVEKQLGKKTNRKSNKKVHSKRSHRKSHRSGRAAMMRSDIKKLDKAFDDSDLDVNSGRQDIANTVSDCLTISPNQFTGSVKNQNDGDYESHNVDIDINSRDKATAYRKATVHVYNILKNLLTKSQRRSVAHDINSARGNIHSYNYGKFVKKLSNANEALANAIGNNQNSNLV